MSVQKFESEVGLMKESGVGQYVKLYDYRTLEAQLAEVTKKYDDLLLTISEEKLLEATDKLTKERDQYKAESAGYFTQALSFGAERDSLKLWQTKAREFIRAVRDDAQKTVDIIDRARAFQESDK